MEKWAPSICKLAAAGWGCGIDFGTFLVSAARKEEAQIRRRKSSFTAGAPSLCADQRGGAT
jgi:hypothetical protein